MSEETTKSASTGVSMQADSASSPQIIYILYLTSIVLGITGVIGVIMAYINRPATPEWLQTHYTYLIHTFWKGLLYLAIGFVLSVVLIGFLVMLFALVWWIVRCVKGMQALGRQEPIINPTGWLFEA